MSEDPRVYGTTATGSIACDHCDVHGLRHTPRVCAYCASVEYARLQDLHCSGCGGSHPGEVCPNRPDDDDPRMADLDDDSPQHEGEV